MNESILDVVHTSAQDLHAAGVLDKSALREFDNLCHPISSRYTVQPRFYTPIDMGQRKVAAC